MNVTRVAVLFFIALFGVVPPASAQDAGAAIAALGNTPEYAAGIYRALLQYEDTLSTHCKDIEFTGENRTTILGRMQLDSSGAISDGKWKETAEGVACGTHRTYNVLVVAKYGVRTYSYLFPGSSTASLELQQSTAAGLKNAIAAAPSCSIEIQDTHRQAADPASGANPREWRETWEVRACGKNYNVPIAFLPDSSGVSIAWPREKVQPH